MEHESVGEQCGGQANQQDEGAGWRGEGVHRARPGGEQQEDEPRGECGHPCRVNGPGLPGEEFAPGPVFCSQGYREGFQDAG